MPVQTVFTAIKAAISNLATSKTGPLGEAKGRNGSGWGEGIALEVGHKMLSALSSCQPNEVRFALVVVLQIRDVKAPFQPVSAFGVGVLAFIALLCIEKSIAMEDCWKAC